VKVEQLVATELGNDLPSGLRLAITRLGRRLRQQAAGQITASQLSALTSVSKSGPVSLGELAAIEQIAPPSMTRIAARLEESGLVERRTDLADRRVARVVITAAGTDLLDQTRTRRDLFLAKRLQRLSPEELQILTRALPVLERLASDDPQGTDPALP
jgi:DNA-binding MarR family transcriptional regulator